MKVIVDGIATEYRDEGSGPALLIIHGWKADLHFFDLLTPLLTPFFRVIRFDLPGFGETEMPPAAWGVSEYAHFVSNFIQKREISPDVILAHSMGGRIVMRGVAEKILSPKKLILVASAGINRMKKYKRAVFFFLAKAGKIITFIPFLNTLGERLRARLYKKIGSNYVDAGPLREIYLKTVREDSTPFAKAITTPTLLIWGEKDSATPLEDGKRLLKLISGSTLKVIPDAGHSVYRHKPEEVASLIKNFAL